MPRTLSGDAEAVVDVPVVGGEVVITFGGDIDKLGEALSDSVFPQPENANQRPDLRRLQQPSVPAPPS